MIIDKEANKTGFCAHISGSISPMREPREDRSASGRSLLRVRSYKEYPQGHSKGCVVHKYAEWEECKNSDMRSDFSEMYTTAAFLTPTGSSVQRSSLVSNNKDNSNNNTDKNRDNDNKKGNSEDSDVHMEQTEGGAKMRAREEMDFMELQKAAKNILMQTAAAIREAKTQQRKSAAKMQRLLNTFMRTQRGLNESTAAAIASANDRASSHFCKNPQNGLRSPKGENTVSGFVGAGAASSSGGSASYMAEWAVRRPNDTADFMNWAAQIFLFSFAVFAGFFAAKNAVSAVVSLATVML